MGMYVGVSYGSVGKIKSDDPYKDWKKHQSKIESLALNHGVNVYFKSQDQGNDGYYLAILNSSISSENIYQDSIFFMDLTVKEDPDFDKKVDDFLEAFWNEESLLDFNDIEFSQVSKLLFT